MKKFMKAFAILCALSLSLTACSGGASTEKKDDAKKPDIAKKIGTAKDGNEEKIEAGAMKLVKATEAGKYKLVDTKELKKWVDAKEDMVIVDTMPAKSFNKNRIPGAVNAELPVKLSEVKNEQKDAFLKLLGENKGKKIVIYCGFVGCERSDVGAVLAKQAGYTNVYRQPGGIIAWIDAGFDAESNK